jgi:antitoxin (DNA-binding transcriptional repressor) of toxin-antitoxin stability system
MPQTIRSLTATRVPREEVNAMTVLTLEEAHAKLPEILERLHPGEGLTITSSGQPVATVIKSERTTWPCQAGTAKGRTFWMAPDFDAPLEDFAEYMR